MAQEISVSMNLAVQKGSLRFSENNSFRPTMAGTHCSHETKDVPTTAGGTALTISNVGAAGGWAWFKNLDTTNYVQVGVQVAGAFYAVVQLAAGESGVFRVGTLSLYALANTGTVTLEFCVLES